MKLMVVDTVGGNRFSDEYQSLLPGIKLRGLELKDDGECHEHGYQVGYLGGCLLPLIEGNHEIVYVRIFDGKGRPVKGSNEWLLDVIESEKPDAVNHSWGQFDGDDRLGDLWGQKAWTKWAERYAAILRDNEITSFSAAGNSDASAPGQPELDEDVDYPWKLIPFINNIIASHQRSGVPSYFSGDGRGVQCAFWADRIFAPLNSGEFVITSGTSFASPKAMAVWSYYVQTYGAWRPFVIDNAAKNDWKGNLPHPKWGYGSLEHTFQKPYQELPIFALPTALNINTEIEVFETLQVKV